MADSFARKKLRQIRQKVDIKRARRCIRNMGSKPVNKVLKVGFIVQMPELWQTEEPVYKIMCNDARFEPWLIIVPEYDVITLDLKDNIGDYYIKQCGNGKYIVTCKDGIWSDIDLDSFDYIFYQRPYNTYLPRHLQSTQVIRHTRTCYVPYATLYLKEAREAGLVEDDFFESIYLGFHEGDDVVDLLNNRYSTPDFKRFLSIGNPTLETSGTLDKTCNYSRVLWAPRWNTDPVIGGSHFLEYYKQLSDFPWGENTLTIRPHPLMWDNFIRKNIITEDEKNKIFACWKERGIVNDGNINYFDTLNDTDILISDISSIMTFFIMTGKPIIYCPFGSDFFELYDLVISGCYIANNWDELESTVKMLLSGEDPLKEKRLKVLNELNMKYNHSSEAIVNYIYTDSAKFTKR
ncbi:CDP-Glycerol:Poly(glycerophosphate) glycerophosphotransferase [Ruminococcaceae bacterium YAD3003]|nr:CDP-Glycerol:Poly(glycerophosphate) glycerophosphotransferase [Ruminococcaceae bacterium YAD3003]